MLVRSILFAMGMLFLGAMTASCGASDSQNNDADTDTDADTDADSDADTGDSVSADSLDSTYSESDSESEYMPPEPCSYEPAVLEEVYALSPWADGIAVEDGGVFFSASNAGLYFQKEGETEPTQIVSGEAYGGRLMDDDFIYIADDSLGTISRLNRNDLFAAPEVLYTTASPSSDLDLQMYTLDEGYIYFFEQSDDGSRQYLRILLTGGDSEVWWEPNELDQPRAVFDGFVYYLHYTNPQAIDEIHNFMRVPVSGGSAETVFAGSWIPYMTIDDSMLVAVATRDRFTYVGDTYVMAPDGSNPQMLAVPRGIQLLDVFGDTIVWTLPNNTIGTAAKDGSGCRVFYYVPYDDHETWSVTPTLGYDGLYVIHNDNLMSKPIRVLRVVL